MILVAGGTGHLGKELVPLLLGHGQVVRVLTRDPGRARAMLGEEVEFVIGDVRDPVSLPAALEGVDAVVSAVTGFGPGGAGPRSVDRDGNVNLIQAAERAEVGQFVLLSMVGAAADHPMELLRMKHQAEEALKSSRIGWAIVRPTVFMELWAGIVGDPILKTGKAVIFGQGDNPVNFISVGDLARFVELALKASEHSGQVIEVGGPENVTFNQLAEAIQAASGRKAAVRHVPLPLMRLAAKLLQPFRPDLAGMIQAGVLTDTRDMTFDSTGLGRLYPEIELTHLKEVVRRNFRAEPAPPKEVEGARR